MFARSMKLTEYFTDILTHHAQTDRCREDGRTSATRKITQIIHRQPDIEAANLMTLRHASPDRGSIVSPIRLNDTFRSTLVLGEREPATMDGDHVQKEMEQAVNRRGNRFNSANMNGAAGVRCLTPAVVDQQ